MSHGGRQGGGSVKQVESPRESGPQRTASPGRGRHAAAKPHGRGGFAFLREFLKAPVELGTCFASSKTLSRVMVDGLDLERAKVVVEYGPGTGALSEEVLARIPKDCKFIAIERNAGLADELRRRWPSIHLHQDDARNVAAICEREGVRPGEVDVVVNSLPFLLFPPELQDELFRKTSEILRPGGRFTLLTYRIEGLMPSVNRVKRLMGNYFSEVQLRARVFQNVPPASVYWCKK
jgi:phosphatidylethanolamine/phosphatidyl-N-methylethanolamine N-methyltransferase